MPSRNESIALLRLSIDATQLPLVSSRTKLKIVDTKPPENPWVYSRNIRLRFEIATVAFDDEGM